MIPNTLLSSVQLFNLNKERGVLVAMNFKNGENKTSKGQTLSWIL